jgi:hypothetical protein
MIAAWLAVAVWLLLWEAGGRRLGRGGTGPWLRAPLWHYAGEALVLTLLGALWFASLGAGAWWMVFLLLGIAVAWPKPGGAKRKRGWAAGELVGYALGAARVVVAGGLLAWRLGP